MTAVAPQFDSKPIFHFRQLQKISCINMYCNKPFIAMNVAENLYRNNFEIVKRSADKCFYCLPTREEY